MLYMLVSQQTRNIYLQIDPSLAELDVSISTKPAIYEQNVKQDGHMWVILALKELEQI